MTEVVSPIQNRHPELVSGSITDATPQKRLKPQIARQVPPSRIACLNQIDLPLPAPRLDPLFARDGGLHRVEHLEMDEGLDAVAAGEAFEGVAAMLRDARHQVGCDAGAARLRAQALP